MKSKIIGRKEECDRLQDCMTEDVAQLVVVYGRRRVGKTFLINEYFENQFAFKMTGSYGKTKSFQLRTFTDELNRKTGSHHSVPKDWIEAFNLLRDYLESLDSNKKHVVFFDEMPWIDTKRSGFLSAFEWFWNDWGSSQDNLVFIVCGSATSWMVDHFANNKGGLFNRQTCKLVLKPFTLHETEEFLNSRDIFWSRYEIAECYMIMGGIPYYLRLLNNRQSFSQNIDRLFFSQNGELRDEFENLYRTLFTDSENYIRVVQALSKKNSGLSRKQISDQTRLPQNGVLSDILKNLVSSGFVRISNYYHQKKKDALYQLSDYYTAFYFHFIKDHTGMDEHFWSNTTDNPSRRSWAGLTFEQLCKDHISQIKHKLGISGVLSEESVWYVPGNEEEGITGAQIDLIIDRRDMVTNLCEMKFSINEYLIDKNYDAVLRNKIDTFRRLTNTRKSLSLTMITTYGIKKNKYSSIVQSQVTLDDLFHE